jgi:hypothetical protein
MPFVRSFSIDEPAARSAAFGRADASGLSSGCLPVTRQSRHCLGVADGIVGIVRIVDPIRVWMAFSASVRKRSASWARWMELGRQMIADYRKLI